jgi:hypothetical protein
MSVGIVSAGAGQAALNHVEQPWIFFARDKVTRRKKLEMEEERL